MLLLVFLNLTISLCAVLKGPGTATPRLANTSYQLQKLPNKQVFLKNTRNCGIKPFYGSRTLATVPSCLEVGDLLDRAVRRVNKFNFKSFLNKYDHLIYTRLIRSLTRIPPITASYVILSTIPAFLSYFFNKNQPFSWMRFDLDKVMKGQVWRLFTPYFLMGQLWINHYLLVGSALTYMANVELSHINKPEKFIEFLTFGVMSLSAYSFLDAYVHRKFSLEETANFENLSFTFHVFVLYFWSRINEGQSVDFMNFFSVPSEFVPYLFILQNLLFYHTGVSSDLVALFFSYLYFTLFSNKKTCPLFRVFRTEALRKLYLKFREEIPY